MDEKELKARIHAQVEKWVSEILKSRFLEKPSSIKPRSLWDKFKQGVANWWWGPKGDKYNPNVWRNRFGDELGVSESFDPSIFTLHEYKEIRGLVEYVEAQINDPDAEFEKLRLMKIIRSAATSLEDMLFNALKGRCTPSAPAVSPEAVAGDKPAPGGDAAAAEPTDPVGRPALTTGVAAAEDEDGGETSSSDPNSTPPPPPANTRGARPRGKKDEAPPAKAAGEGAAKEKSAAAEPSTAAAAEEAPGRVQQKDHSELFDYLQVGGKIGGFYSEVSKFIDDDEKANALGEEIKDEIQEYKAKVNGAEADKKIEIMNGSLGAIVKSVASALGVSEEKAQEIMIGYLKEGKVDLTQRQAAPEDEKKVEPEDDEVDSSLGLESYVKDGNALLTRNESLKRLDRMIEKIPSMALISGDDDRVANLKDWWKKERDSVSQDSEPLKRLQSQIISSDSYIKTIADILKKSENLVKSAMVKHIQKKSSRRN